jgi:hypothetical protein
VLDATVCFIFGQRKIRLTKEIVEVIVAFKSILKIGINELQDWNVFAIVEPVRTQHNVVQPSRVYGAKFDFDVADDVAMASLSKIGTASHESNCLIDSVLGSSALQSYGYEFGLAAVIEDASGV